MQKRLLILRIPMIKIRRTLLKETQKRPLTQRTLRGMTAAAQAVRPKRVTVARKMMAVKAGMTARRKT